MEHEIKCEIVSFTAICSSLKKFTIRKNDRHYQKGDTLIMCEISQDGKYTGGRLRVIVGWMTNYMQKEDYVVISFNEVEVLSSKEENGECH